MCYTPINQTTGHLRRSSVRHFTLSRHHWWRCPIRMVVEREKRVKRRIEFDQIQAMASHVGFHFCLEEEEEKVEGQRPGEDLKSWKYVRRKSLHVSDRHQWVETRKVGLRSRAEVAPNLKRKKKSFLARQLQGTPPPFPLFISLICLLQPYPQYALLLLLLELLLLLLFIKMRGLAHLNRKVKEAINTIVKDNSSPRVQLNGGHGCYFFLLLIVQQNIIHFHPDAHTTCH